MEMIKNIWKQYGPLIEIQIKRVLLSLLTAAIAGGIAFLASWGVIIDQATVGSGLATSVAVALTAIIMAAVDRWVMGGGTEIVAAAQQAEPQMAVDAVAKSDPVMLLTAAAKVPEVVEITTRTDELSKSVPSDKVVTE